MGTDNAFEAIVANQGGNRGLRIGAPIPPVPARFMGPLDDKDPHRDREGIKYLLVCGVPACSADFCKITVKERCEGYPHTLSWKATFTRDATGVYRLTPRAQRQWEGAKCQGTSWPQFRVRTVRPAENELSVQDLLWAKEHSKLAADGKPRLHYKQRDSYGNAGPEGAFRLMCPVCERVNAVDVPRVCEKTCPIHHGAYQSGPSSAARKAATARLERGGLDFGPPD